MTTSNRPGLNYFPMNIASISIDGQLVPTADPPDATDLSTFRFQLLIRIPPMDDVSTPAPNVDRSQIVTTLPSTMTTTVATTHYLTRPFIAATAREQARPDQHDNARHCELER